MKETKFKDTEVGRIPEDWEATRIDKLCCLKARIGWQGLTTGEYLPQGDYVLVTGTDFNDGYIDWKNCYYVSKWRYDQDINIQIKEGDVLISKDGTIGKVAFLDSIPGPGTLNSGVFVVRPKQDNVMNKAYLSWIFKSIWFKSFIDQLTAGSTINHLYQKDFVKFQLVYPNDISEQSRIATALSAIDNLISELGKLIDKKRAIKQGAMQQLLTGKKRLKGFNEPWVEKKLGEDALILRGGSPRPIEDYITDSQDGLNWIKIGDVKPNDKYFRKTAEKIKKEGLNKTRQVKKGDFILSNSMSFGRPYILDIDGCIHDGWLVIQDYQETYDMLFLYYILCSDAVMNQYASMAAGSSVQNLNKEKVANVLLYAPSSLKEQSAIAKVLSSMDEEISFLEAKREKYNAIKQGMMQQLLTGKIRLVETAVKPNATSANVHFRRSVWAAEIAERLYEEPTFGHVKMEKILFLTERLCHIDIGSHYHRDAAGPYDNNALRSIDSQLKKQKWFEVQRTEKGYRYVPMRNCGKHKTYFNRYYSGIVPMFDKIINTFKTQNTERCEIVATLYSAWEDLLHSNKSFTDADIVNEVLNNWHESKKRISQDRWLKAIQWMRDNGFAPDMSVYMK
ncbi:restriction endonuclease subunit S [Bacteroides gallinaceum]|uniref:restriction endonuclease subunit S n=1 Tax=Bacteroides gallinaceum TaxID=1462571 RepID=UPI0025A4C687|nr:restriction endonuclease subunit S [Bacteroides gallinaceum]MDM8207224.1 restriction endonuclease subunit S [Bacteroides gallinaceum]